jgi:hypothetical protein
MNVGNDTGDKYRTSKVTNMGNSSGDEFGKLTPENITSTNLFLGDELGKYLGDEFGTSGSPGFSWLLR